MFAERLRKTLSDLSISRYKLAKDLNISQQTVANWYHGENEPKAILCNYLDVSADYLLGISDEY
jgi:transcriptional regulator with XRE-family HTH domain